MNIQITPEQVLNCLSQSESPTLKGFWAEYNGNTIAFGIRQSLQAGEYDRMMNLAVSHLRDYGFNAHRTDPDELRALGAVYPPGVKPAPQTELGEDGIYRLDCTSKVRKQFMEAMHSGEVVKIDQPLWTYYFEQLPPRSMGKTMVWIDDECKTHRQHTDFTLAEASCVIAFWHTDKQYFCMQAPPNALLI